MGCDQRTPGEQHPHQKRPSTGKAGRTQRRHAQRCQEEREDNHPDEPEGRRRKRWHELPCHVSRGNRSNDQQVRGRQQGLDKIPDDATWPTLASNNPLVGP